MHLRSCFLTLTILIAVGCGPSGPKYPEHQGYVNDTANVLSKDVRKGLETQLQDLSKRGVELVIVTVPNIGGETIEQYSLKLAEKWKIGKEGKDNGLLLLIAIEEKRVRLEVGYGLESEMTDIGAGRLIEEEISPAFQSRDFDHAVVGATQKISDKLAAKGGKIGKAESKFTSEQIFFGVLILVVVLIIVALIFPDSLLLFSVIFDILSALTSSSSDKSSGGSGGGKFGGGGASR